MRLAAEGKGLTDAMPSLWETDELVTVRLAGLTAAY